jgi:multisubunit Na+/H+ antiporter MnhG subunit
MMLVLLANLIVVLHLPFHLLFLFLTLDFTMFSLKKVNYRREAPEMGRYAS